MNNLGAIGAGIAIGATLVFGADNSPSNNCDISFPSTDNTIHCGDTVINTAGWGRSLSAPDFVIFNPEENVEYVSALRNAGLEIVGSPDIVNRSQNCYSYAFSSTTNLSIGDPSLWINHSVAIPILQDSGIYTQVVPRVDLDDLSSGQTLEDLGLEIGDIQIGDIVVLGTTYSYSTPGYTSTGYNHAMVVIGFDRSGRPIMEGKMDGGHVLRGLLNNQSRFIAEVSLGLVGTNAGEGFKRNPWFEVYRHK